MAVVTVDEYIEFQHASYVSLTVGTPAMRASDWSFLYSDPAKVGSDVHLIGQDGVDPQDRVGGPLRGILQIDVFGRKDADGVKFAHGDVARGLVTNLQTLKQVTAVKTVQTIILHRRDGTAPSASCQVLDGPRPTWDWPVVRCILDVQLPGGALL